MSRHSIPSTNSLDTERGCLSYQSRTSFSVSNTLGPSGIISFKSQTLRQGNLERIFGAALFCYALRNSSIFWQLMSGLTHLDEHGRATMVDTSDKPSTTRRAKASARVLMSPETIAAIRAQSTPKGDPLEPARLAGIMAAKRTAELIPL